MQDPRRGRFELLRANSDFRLLFVATAGSAIGTYLAALVLSVEIYDATGSGRWLALLLVADFMPIVVIGLLFGPLVDRLSRKWLMVASDLARFGAFCALPLVHDPSAIVALAALNGIATGFFRPAVWAGLPNLVAEGDREQATSLLSTVEHLAWTLGPVAAGAMLAAWGPNAAYLLNAATFLFSALLILGIPAARLRSEESLSRGHWRDVRDGLGLVVHTRPLLTVLIVWNIAAIATAGINVSEIFLAKDELSSGNVGLGILVAATGIGLIVGSFFAATALAQVGMRVAYGGSLALMGIGFGLAAAAPTLAIAAVLAGVATIGNGCAIVCNQILVQRGAPDAMRGRALAVLMSTYYATLGIGMAAAGAFTDVVGARAIWAVAGAVYLTAALVALVMTRRMREDAIARLAEEAAGMTRLQELLEEIEATRRAELERPRRELPYIPRAPELGARSDT